MKSVLGQATVVSVILKIIAIITVIIGFCLALILYDSGYGLEGGIAFAIFVIGLIGAIFLVGFAIVIDLLAAIASSSEINSGATTISRDELPSL